MAGNQPRQLTKPYPEPGAPCIDGDITNHAIGQYCFICTRIKMPWGGFLPITRYQGLPVAVGRAGTILHAIQVDSPREITLLAMAAWAITTDQWKNAVKINRGIERARIKASAHALADIADVAAQKPDFADLKWWDILQEALMSPTLTVAAYKERICGPAPAPGLVKLKFKSSNPIVLPDDDDEQDDEDLGYDDSDNITDGKKLMFFSRGEADEDDEDELVDTQSVRKISPWKFAKGQDLDPAYWATPDPSKFFMVLQLRKDPSKINVREYPHIGGFDWNDKEAVKALNRGRNQIVLRTNGPKTPPRLAWSQKEKDLLRHQLILGLKHGYTKISMPWEQVAHNINVDLENVTQRKGSLLARPSKWNFKTKKEDFQMKKHLTMQKDRIGSERNATGCMNQATKFGDLDALLRNSVEQPSKRKPLDDMIQMVSANQSLDAAPRACINPSTKKAGTNQAKSGRGSAAPKAVPMQVANEGESFTTQVVKTPAKNAGESSPSQADKVQTEDVGGSSANEPSPIQSERMQTDSTDDSSDDEPLMKRRQSCHDEEKSSANEPLLKRRKPCKDHGQ